MPFQLVKEYLSARNIGRTRPSVKIKSPGSTSDKY
jgi:hypothetical protein